ERAHALRSILQTAAEDDDLFLEALDRLLELGDLPLVVGQPAFVLRGHHSTSSVVLGPYSCVQGAKRASDTVTISAPGAGSEVSGRCGSNGPTRFLTQSCDKFKTWVSAAK